MSNYPTQALRMQHADDPTLEITQRTRELIEQLSLVNPYEVLVGIYERPEKTSSGVYLPERLKGEDIFQGKVGLVLKLGELAFTKDTDRNWPDVVPKVGDWIAFRVSDSWQLLLGKQACRLVPDTAVRLILEEPDVIY